MISQGEIWWAELGEPTGSAPGYRRPLLVVQGDALNRTSLATVVCVGVTSNLKWAEAPGNLRLSPAETGLPRESVVNVSQIITVDREQLVERLGKLSRRKVFVVLAGIDVVLGR